MTFAELSPTEQAEVTAFLRDYRAAFAATVRGLRTQSLLAMAYTSHVGAAFAKLGASDVISDGNGLAGADLELTVTELTPMFTWTVNVLAGVYSDNGGAVATVWPSRETVDAYGVQLAGPTNIG